MATKAGTRGANRLKKLGQRTYPAMVSCPSCGRSLHGEDWERVVVTGAGSAVHIGDCHQALIRAAEKQIAERAADLRAQVQSGVFHVHPGALAAMKGSA
ncbi:hypothetical protein ABMY26_06560 (plasmid) [Azospirillum sp. HJ39]|uniref:hypothetical protein n=1 Tax=Azospirillum sp. HJ39 TaxID=3159496 RepID=UPI0035591811